MKLLRTVLFQLFFFGCLGLSYGQNRPNIVVFLVDDMGWMDTSLPFGDNVMELNKRYNTPNMARLANQGMSLRTRMQHRYARLRG